jgi:cytochrome c-type biogenesis protein
VIGAGITGVLLGSSFAAGVVSFLSPCVLPIVPGYLSYLAGQTIDAKGRESGAGALLRPALFFVLGFSSVFVAMGAGATAVGRLFLAHRYEMTLLGGAVVVLFGLSMTGTLKLRFLARDWRFHLELPGGRSLAAYILGLAFAFGWTPCIGPVLGTILTMSASRATLSQGVILLGFYSLGLGLPFLAAALFTESLISRLQPLSRIGRSLQLGAGAVVALLGVLIMTGQLSAVSYWLLDAFPGFARLG